MDPAIQPSVNYPYRASLSGTREPGCTPRGPRRDGAVSTDPGSAGYVPRLLSAAAFVTRRATEQSLEELRLTQERAAILRILAKAPACEAALSAASGLAAGCVRDCVLVLECCGYAAAGPDGSWAATPAGQVVLARANEAEARLLSRGYDDVEGLRQELHALIAALTPPPGSMSPDTAADKAS